MVIALLKCDMAYGRAFEAKETIAAWAFVSSFIQGGSLALIAFTSSASKIIVVGFPCMYR